MDKAQSLWEQLARLPAIDPEKPLVRLRPLWLHRSEEDMGDAGTCPGGEALSNRAS